MKYEIQPARAVMREKGWTTATLAREIRVSEIHLLNVLRGLNRPCEQVVRRMPAILATPLDQLLAPAMLEALRQRAYNPDGGRPRRFEVSW